MKSKGLNQNETPVGLRKNCFGIEEGVFAGGEAGCGQALLLTRKEKIMSQAEGYFSVPPPAGHNIMTFKVYSFSEKALK